MLLAISQLLYALSPSVWPVIASRALMGIAATNSTACRTVVADGATREERTAHTAAISAASSLGFVCGPAIGGLLFLLPGASLRAPGWCGLGLAALNVALVLLLVRPPAAAPRASSSRLTGRATGGGEAESDLTAAPAPSAEDEEAAGERSSSFGERSPQRFRSSSFGDNFESVRLTGVTSGGALADAADAAEPAAPPVSYGGLVVLGLVQLARTMVDSKARLAFAPSPRGFDSRLLGAAPAVLSAAWAPARLAEHSVPTHREAPLVSCTQALTSPFASFEALVTPFTEEAYGFSLPAIGVLFAGASRRPPSPASPPPSQPCHLALPPPRATCPIRQAPPPRRCP